MHHPAAPHPRPVEAGRTGRDRLDRRRAPGPARPDERKPGRWNAPGAISTSSDAVMVGPRGSRSWPIVARRSSPAAPPGAQPSPSGVRAVLPRGLLAARTSPAAPPGAQPSPSGARAVLPRGLLARRSSPAAPDRRPLSSSEIARSSDVLLVGAGSFGAWTAWHLRRDGRIRSPWSTRSAPAIRGRARAASRASFAAGYGDRALYSRWAHASLPQWREVLAAAGRAHLFRQTGVLWLGHDDDPHVEGTARTLATLGVATELLTRAELGKRFPQLDLDRHHARRARAAKRRPARAPGGARGGGRGPAGRRRLPSRIGRSERHRASHGDAAEVRLGDGTPPGGGNARLRLRAMAAAALPGTPRPADPHDAPGGLLLRHPVRGPPLRAAGPASLDRLPRRRLRAAGHRGPRRQGRPDRPRPALRSRPRGPRAVAGGDGRGSGGRHPRGCRGSERRRVVEARVCQYSNTPSGDLLIDRHPAHGSVWLAGGGSGHGFKLGPAVGAYVSGRLAGRAAAEPLVALAAHGAGRERAVL